MIDRLKRCKENMLIPIDGEKREREKKYEGTSETQSVARPLFGGLSIARIRTKSLNPHFTEIFISLFIIISPRLKFESLS